GLLHVLERLDEARLVATVGGGGRAVLRALALLLGVAVVVALVGGALGGLGVGGAGGSIGVGDLGIARGGARVASEDEVERFVERLRETDLLAAGDQHHLHQRGLGAAAGLR